jgi:hypothetical protein
MLAEAERRLVVPSSLAGLADASSRPVGVRVFIRSSPVLSPIGDIALVAVTGHVVKPFVTDR